MSQEQFYQTVQLQEEYEMKTWLEQYIEHTADELVCTYCHEVRGDALACCDERSWSFFRDLPVEEQNAIAKKEWERNHKEMK